VDQLGELGERALRAVGRLERLALSSREDRDLVEHALRAALRIAPDETTADVVFDALYAKDLGERDRASQALATIGARAVPVIREALDSAPERLSVIALLEAVGDDAIPELGRLAAEDFDYRVRAGSAQAIARIVARRPPASAPR
jgi:HEAT repeat protein